MTNFQILTRSETNSIYSSYSINEYDLDEPADKEQVLKDFLKAENFKHEDFHKIIRLNNDPGRNFLGHALNLEQIEVADFKKFTKKELLAFFRETLKPAVPAAALREEERLQAKFISMLATIETDSLYLISRDFFDTSLPHEVYFDTHKLLYDGIIYDPYFLLCWFSEKHILSVCEYLSD